MRARELTSAEAGFAFAAMRRKEIRDSGSARVDPWRAWALKAYLEAEEQKEERGDPEEVAEVEEMLLEAGVQRWLEREAEGLSERDRRAIGAIVERLGPGTGSLWRSVARKELTWRLARRGSDLSPLEKGCLDLRQWCVPKAGLPVAARLVVLGAVIMATMDSRATRRRLAASLSRLPPRISEEVRVGLSRLGKTGPELERRIYEVYGQIGGEKNPADLELAALGMCFLISASATRQYRVVQRSLKENVPSELQGRVELYLRAALGSRKPELAPLVAAMIEAIEREKE